jgi:peptidoglycan/xylan/chitin deacetylase (PgdA/CDA1 family)
MRFTFLIFTAIAFLACNNTSIKQSEHQTATRKPTATAPEILAKKQVPVLCYHQIRAWKSNDSESTKDYVVAPETFKEHIKMLADSGYTSILPDQLYEYLSLGKTLPKKPVMITFDDTDVEQFTLAAPELKKYGFKGVFFIMTVSIGRPRYMSSDQIKSLSDAGHVIASHTWDHQNFKKYTAEDWIAQVDKPTKRLEEITGKKITYFAYPFGLWNADGIPELKKRGFKAAFQLSAKRDEKEPLYTIRRNIASGKWNAKTLHRIMINNF